ncbi:TetR/AcrR family transcriptional regulator [Niveispirillum sp.]|uniref:TetR/AcrR family transcriptional regulator n=1 Tax=Niveispirillum sp. TaxID=1917217 RepID=UPI001B429961|nr:TetR/AcrR family transcriptional regulator [Niveispirillum sp.]MBP7337162.1 TetR/AcrR family transcriptional regulator [Niveispirillum sp.]
MSVAPPQSVAPKRPRTSPPEVRRAELLAAARQVIVDKGFAAMRVSDVVALAGLSQGAFYLHFKSKEEVVVEIMREVVQETAVALRAIPQADLSLADAIRAIVRNYYAVCLHHRSVLERLDSPTVSGVDQTQWAAVYEPLNSFALESCQDWQRRGLVSTAVGANVLSWLMIDAINGALPRLFGRAGDHRASTDYPDLIAEWIEAAMRNLRPAGAKAAG